MQRDQNLQVVAGDLQPRHSHVADVGFNKASGRCFIVGPKNLAGVDCLRKTGTEPAFVFGERSRSRECVGMFRGIFPEDYSCCSGNGAAEGWC